MSKLDRGMVMLHASGAGFQFGLAFSAANDGHAWLVLLFASLGLLSFVLALTTGSAK